MEKRKAEPNVVQHIFRLAGQPEQVEPSTTAYYDLLGLHLTKTDICDAICNWIDKGKPVQEIVTEYADGHIGEPAYVMKPDLSGVRCYVKVAIQEGETPDGKLLIISAHLDR